MANLYDAVKVTTTTVGTGNVTLGAAVAGYVSFTDHGITNGTSVEYVIEDGNNREIGVGTWVTGNILQRTTIISTLVAGVFNKTTPTAMSLSGSAVVMCIVTAHTLPEVASQTANTVFAAPSGSGGLPTFRLLDAVDMSAGLHGATAKTSTVDADEFHLNDSATSFALKKITWANLKTAGKAYYDTLYNPKDGANTASTISTTGVVSIGGSATPGASLSIPNNIAGATSSRATYSNGTIQSGVTTAATYFQSVANTAAAAFTLTSLEHYSTSQGTFGTGSTITTQVGYHVNSSLTGATNNYGFRGQIPAGTGRYNLYMNGTASNYMAGSLGIGTTPQASVKQIITSTSSGAPTLALMLQNRGSAANTEVVLGFICSATDYSDNRYASISAINTDDSNATDLIFKTGSAGTHGTERMRITSTGSIVLPKTIIATGTTGAQTINKPTGSVNFAAAATSLVVTNSLVTTNSIIICQIASNDATMKSVQVVAAAGSFTIYANAAATAETRVNFLITN